MKESPFTIDAVITWVDGNDLNHKSKIEDYLEGSKSSMNNKSIKMRYGQVNEIEFVVKSILKYAKFVRNIFIVTDNQTPDFLKDKNKAKKEYPSVFIVDHKVIFEEYHEYLPTFNSLSIETLLYRIPNLSEHFLYFNDDCFIINEVKISDFFINEYPVIRGRWKLYYENIWYKKIKLFYKNRIIKNKNIVYKHTIGLQKPAKMLGFKKYVYINHTPMVFRKSTLAEFFKKEPKILEENIRFRFRNPKQFVCHSLINHLEISNGTFSFKKDYQLVYFQNYKKPFIYLKSKLRRASKNKNKLFLCLQSLNQCPKEKLTYINQWLNNKYN